MAKKALKVKVIKKSGDKTCMCELVTLKKHPVYSKFVKVRRKYMAHDEDNSHKVGDIVMIQEHKPFSKRKTWIILKEDKEDNKDNKDKKGKKKESKDDTNGK